MKNIKTLEEIEKKLNELKQKRILEVQNIKDIIEEKQAIIEDATNKITYQDTPETYKELKRKIEDARDDIEFYNKKLEALNKKSFAEDELCVSFLNEIHSEQQKKLDEFKETLKTLLIQIDDVSKETFDYIDTCNSFIKKWCKDIKPFQKVAGTRNGQPVYLDTDPACYDHGKYVDFINKIHSYGVYSNITGKSITVEKPKLNFY